jgi:hypothetical protein
MSIELKVGVLYRYKYLRTLYSEITGSNNMVGSLNKADLFMLLGTEDWEYAISWVKILTTTGIVGWTTMYAGYIEEVTQDE